MEKQPKLIVFIFGARIVTFWQNKKQIAKCLSGTLAIRVSCTMWSVWYLCITSPRQDRRISHVAEIPNSPTASRNLPRSPLWLTGKPLSVPRYTIGRPYLTGRHKIYLKYVVCHRSLYLTEDHNTIDLISKNSRSAVKLQRAEQGPC